MRDELLQNLTDKDLAARALLDKAKVEADSEEAFTIGFNLKPLIGTNARAVFRHHGEQYHLSEAADKQWQRKRIFIQTLNDDLPTSLPSRHPNEQGNTSNYWERIALKNLRCIGRTISDAFRSCITLREKPPSIFPILVAQLVDGIFYRTSTESRAWRWCR
jgi:hypothetical protein